MNTSPGPLELFRLGDETQYLSVIVLGRDAPGVLPYHDVLRVGIIIETGIGTLRLENTLDPIHVDDLEGALDSLADNAAFSWLGSRLPGIEVEPEDEEDEDDYRLVSVFDLDQSGVAVQVLLTIDVAENHDRLEAVRRAYPREVVETSPGVFQWASPRTGPRPEQPPQ